MGWINKYIERVRKKISMQDKKKSVENAAIIIIIGVIILIAGNTFFGKDPEESRKSTTGEKQSVQEASKNMVPEEGTDIEKRIEKVLSQIDGAGRVTVLITYSSGKELVPATDVKKNDNDTDEKDNAGGTRRTRQNDYESHIAYEEEQGGSKKPIIIKEILPEVKGVVVVADGASDPKVKEALSRAVMVLVDVPVHKIQVFERSR